jgi:DNA-binding IclR family transcriptional regulator
MTKSETTERVYAAVKAHFDREHYPPTRRELAAATGLSPTSIGTYLNELVDQGRVKYAPRKHRGIQLCRSES